METDETSSVRQRRPAHATETAPLDPDYDLRDTLFQEDGDDDLPAEETEAS